MDMVDEVVLVSTKDAEAQARQAAVTQGLLVRFIPVHTPGKLRCMHAWYSIPRVHK